MALRIATVLACALAAGHVVQTLRQVPPELAQAVPLAEPPDAATLPKLAGITAVSGSSSGTDSSCDLVLRLVSAPNATISLSLAAPCNLGERAVIRHAGLTFAETVGADGRLQVQFPAMGTDAAVAVYVGGSEMVLGRISVPDAAGYLRVAVQIAGGARFDLRAEEMGQVFVARSAGPDGVPQRITALGQVRMENPLLSQVYSVALKQFSNPKLMVELRITPETCGRTLAAEVIQSQSGDVSQTTHAIEVPLCGTSGDILLLKNLLPDLTLATLE